MRFVFHFFLAFRHTASRRLHRDTFPLALIPCVKASIKPTHRKHNEGVEGVGVGGGGYCCCLMKQRRISLSLLCSLSFPADPQSFCRSTQPPHLPVCLLIPTVPRPSTSLHPNTLHSLNNSLHLQSLCMNSPSFCPFLCSFMVYLQLLSFFLGYINCTKKERTNENVFFNIAYC